MEGHDALTTIAEAIKRQNELLREIRDQLHELPEEITEAVSRRLVPQLADRSGIIADETARRVGDAVAPLFLRFEQQLTAQRQGRQHANDDDESRAPWSGPLQQPRRRPGGETIGDIMDAERKRP